MEIERLPEELNRAGLTFRLYKRGTRAMIYSQGEDPYKCYEVFLIRVDPGGEVFGKHYGPREKYPASEDFGRWAVWCPDLEKALVWFELFEGATKGQGYVDLKAKLGERTAPPPKRMTRTKKSGKLMALHTGG